MTIKEFFDKFEFYYDADNNIICDIGAIELYYDTGNIIKTMKCEEIVLVPFFITDLFRGYYDDKEWINQKIANFKIFISGHNDITISIRVR